MLWSALGESYQQYERTLFIETLCHWGWYGKVPPPSWYTGEPWTA